MKIHPSISADLIMNAVESNDYVGFCIACGAEHYNIEPDAERYTCEVCEDQTVYGAETIFIMADALLK